MPNFRKIAENSVTRTNCNPILWIGALALIVFGLMYHFRSAIIHVVVLTLMWLAGIFLAFAAVHIARHILRWHSHSHAEVEDAEVAEAKSNSPTVVDPVTQAEDVLSAALENLGTEADAKATE
jgi:hypothetical protein